MANPEEVVNRFIKAIERRELDTAMDFVTEDCFYDNVPIGSMTGKTKMAEFLSGLLNGPGPVTGHGCLRSGKWFNHVLARLLRQWHVYETAQRLKLLG
jgi:hypothetical protein